MDMSVKLVVVNGLTPRIQGYSCGPGCFVRSLAVVPSMCYIQREITHNSVTKLYFRNTCLKALISNVQYRLIYILIKK